MVQLFSAVHIRPHVDAGVRALRFLDEELFWGINELPVVDFISHTAPMSLLNTLPEVLNPCMTLLNDKRFACLHDAVRARTMGSL